MLWASHKTTRQSYIKQYIKRAAPKPATARGFHGCICASVCVCVPTCIGVEGFALRCSCIMFLGPIPGTCFFLDFVCLRKNCRSYPRCLFKAESVVSGSRPRAPWGTLGAKIRPGCKKGINMDFRALPSEIAFGKFSVRNLENSFDFFVLFFVFPRPSPERYFIDV